MAEDDTWDSWEDFADCGDIDKHVEQGLNKPNEPQPKSKDKHKKQKQISRNECMSSQKERNNTSPQPGIRILARPPVVHEEDVHRTPFMPQLKILKRPEKSTEEQRIAEEQRKRLSAQQPVRTFAQREAAYAEARQRIMGVDVEGINETPGKANNPSSRPENLKRYSKQSKVYQNGHSNGVKRQPKGPGNGKGFKHGK